MKKILFSLLVLGLVLGLMLPMAATVLAAGVSGAIWTTNSTGDAVNMNQYEYKTDVYVNGGPKGGGGGLPDGDYYVKVMEPNGTLLGSSYATATVHVTDGNFDAIYQLWAVVWKASNSSAQGYDDTTNPGYEYKVWVSQNPDFPESESKTDNFKVRYSEGGGGPAEVGMLHVLKFYDANANGVNDDGILITGWKVNICDSISQNFTTPVDLDSLMADDYTVTEFSPIETNWVHTTATSVNITLESGEDETVEFGNVCLGPGGGLTLGFWSNKNGQKAMGTGAVMTATLSFLSGLNLRNAAGTNFDPGSYTAFRTWLLSATATNMAYMLSAQLAAMELNVRQGFVNGSALVYAPELLPFAPITGLNALGFISVNNLTSAANTELGLHGLTLSGSPYRAYQEALKNALDAANNNKIFVQAGPCPFSFIDP
jgi:hypothetical protein